MLGLKLNKRDKAVLKLLSENSRVSLSEISKKVKIPKSTVYKKLQKFSREKVASFTTLIDDFRLGNNRVFIYLKTSGISRSEIKNRLQELRKDRKILWICDLFGEFDIEVLAVYKNSTELDAIISWLKGALSESLVELDVHLIKEQFSSSIYTNKVRRIGICEDHIEISPKAWRLLNEIRRVSRFEYTDLCAKLSVYPKTLKRMIRDLESKNIIKGYITRINYKSIGLLCYICVLDILPSRGDASEMVSFLNGCRDIPFITTTIRGKVIFDFVCAEFHHFREFMDELRDRFKEIQNYRYFSIEKT